jgi:hypothetical protein
VCQRSRRRRRQTLGRSVCGRVRWLKIKNPDYSQKEGRSELFNGLRQWTARTAG